MFLIFIFVSNSFSQWGWFQNNSGITGNINDIGSLNASFWVVADIGKILRTSNNGLNWIDQPSGTTNNLNAITFADFASYTYRGYIVGANGTALRTSNSGITWNLLSTGISQVLNDVCEMRDTFTVIAVGNNGTIIKSTNSGASWMVKTCPTTNDLYGVIQSFVSVVCAVGEAGTVLVSFDLGDNWIQVQSGTSNNLYSISKHNTVYANMVASGGSGTIIKTSNGGVNWSPIYTNTTQDLYEVQVMEWNYYPMQFTYYFACGTNGTIITSTNLGANWVSPPMPVTADLKAIRFKDINTGFAGANEGMLIRTFSNHYYIDKKRMDANSIGTWFGNDGGFNRNSDSVVAGFEFPRGSGKISRYTSGLVIGAIVGYDTLLTVSHYTPNENYPGYTDNYGIPHGRNDSNYRIYKLISGVNNPDRLAWPNVLLGNSNQGAPVYFDNLSNTWKPLDFGSQTLFSVFTDSYPESHNNGYCGTTAPLQADIKLLSFALDTTGVLGNVIFSQYTIINRSAYAWNDAYITLWTDDDIGDGWNDKLGCDSLLKLGYTYNGTGNDTSYANTSPAVGFLLLKGAIVPTGNNYDTVWVCNNKTKSFLTGVRDRGMKVFNYSINADMYDPDPSSYYQCYRLMKGLNIEGGNRYHPQGGYVTTLAFSGDPVLGTGWNQGVYNDMRSFLSTGPVNMNPGDTQIIVAAQVIARGTSSLNSVTLLKQYTSIVKQYYDSCYSFIPIGIKNQNEIVYNYALYQNYPNPFNPKTRIVFTIPKQENVRIEIYDITGKLIEVLADKNYKQGKHYIEWDGSNFSSGVYFYRLTTQDYSETRKMVLIK